MSGPITVPCFETSPTCHSSSHLSRIPSFVTSLLLSYLTSLEDTPCGPPLARITLRVSVATWQGGYRGDSLGSQTWAISTPEPGERLDSSVTWTHRNYRKHAILLRPLFLSVSTPSRDQAQLSHPPPQPLQAGRLGQRAEPALFMPRWC